MNSKIKFRTYLLNAGIPQNEMEWFAKIKWFTNTLLETLPQLVIQLVYVIQLFETKT